MQSNCALKFELQILIIKLLATMLGMGDFVQGLLVEREKPFYGDRWAMFQISKMLNYENYVSE